MPPPGFPSYDAVYTRMLPYQGQTIDMYGSNDGQKIGNVRLKLKDFGKKKNE